MPFFYQIYTQIFLNPLAAIISAAKGPRYEDTEPYEREENRQREKFIIKLQEEIDHLYHLKYPTLPTSYLEAHSGSGSGYVSCVRVPDPGSWFQVKRSQKSNSFTRRVRRIQSKVVLFPVCESLETNHKLKYVTD